jgi:hypothetical protein
VQPPSTLPTQVGASVPSAGLTLRQKLNDPTAICVLIRGRPFCLLSCRVRSACNDPGSVMPATLKSVAQPGPNDLPIHCPIAHSVHCAFAGEPAVGTCRQMVSPPHALPLQSTVAEHVAYDCTDTLSDTDPDTGQYLAPNQPVVRLGVFNSPGRRPRPSTCTGRCCPRTCCRAWARAG